MNAPISRWIPVSILRRHSHPCKPMRRSGPLPQKREGGNEAEGQRLSINTVPKTRWAVKKTELRRKSASRRRQISTRGESREPNVPCVWKQGMRSPFTRSRTSHSLHVFGAVCGEGQRKQRFSVPSSVRLSLCPWFIKSVPEDMGS